MRGNRILILRQTVPQRHLEGKKRKPNGLGAKASSSAFDRSRLWKKEKIELKVTGGEIIPRERMVNSSSPATEEKDVEGNTIIILLFSFLFVV